MEHTMNARERRHARRSGQRVAEQVTRTGAEEAPFNKVRGLQSLAIAVEEPAKKLSAIEEALAAAAKAAPSDSERQLFYATTVPNAPWSADRREWNTDLPEGEGPTLFVATPLRPLKGREDVVPAPIKEFRAPVRVIWRNKGDLERALREDARMQAIAAAEKRAAERAAREADREARRKAAEEQREKALALKRQRHATSVEASANAGSVRSAVIVAAWADGVKIRGDFVAVPGCAAAARVAAKVAAENGAPRLSAALLRLAHSIP